MRFIDIIALSFSSFKNRTSRVVLTTLGVAVGIAVIMFLVSIGYGLQRTILSRITTSEALLTLDVTSPDPLSVPLTDATVQELGGVSHVAEVSSRAVYSARMSLGTLNSETRVYVVTPNYFRLSGLETDTGTTFVDEDTDRIVITSIVAELLGKDDALIIGETITLDILFDEVVPDPESGQSSVITNSFQKTGMVIGVLQDTETASEVYVARNDLAGMSVVEYESIKVQVDDGRNLEAVRSELTELGYVVSAVSDLVDQANRVFAVLQFILGIFGIFSLIVAAIGLVNTMTISLLERTNEIGIMRALGATRRDIQKLFLIESSLIGLFGGVAGLVLGLGGGLVFNVVLNIVARALGGNAVSIFYTPFWFVVVVVFSSTVVGFISGFFPARRASGLNTLEALRYK